MAATDITSATTSNMTNNVEDFDFGSTALDSPRDQKETEYINSNWGKQLNIYKTIPEFKIALDMRAIWTVGKKVKADPYTTVILDHVSGWGNDTFRTILKNMVTVKRLGQDAFAEIIRDEDSGTIINIKVLDPSTIKTIVNSKGIILRYEQINRGMAQPINFKPNQILHFCNKRVGDEIHGVSDSEALEAIIKASKENFDDVRISMHRYVKPMMKFILDTDNVAKIDALVAKFDAAVNKGENLYIPKGAVEHEIIAIPANSTLNPMPWREHLRNYFFQVVGMPQIVLGSSGEFTESTAKIAYLAFQQSVEDEQTDIEDAIWNQLGLKIELEFPATIQNELISDTNKDKNQGMEIQAGDTTVSGA
jgi:hypothetical protein